MKFIIILTLCVGGCLIFAGCNSAETNTVRSSSNSSAAIPAEVIDTTSTSANSTASNSTTDNSNSSMASARQIAQLGITPEIESQLKQAAHPAPENSEFASVVADTTIEVRTFKSHPLLTKVVKVIREEGSTVTVYYTDGHIVPLPANFIESLSTISSAEILHIAAPGPRREKRKARAKNI